MESKKINENTFYCFSVSRRLSFWKTINAEHKILHSANERHTHSMCDNIIGMVQYLGSLVKGQLGGLVFFHLWKREVQDRRSFRRLFVVVRHSRALISGKERFIKPEKWSYPIAYENHLSKNGCLRAAFAVSRFAGSKARNLWTRSTAVGESLKRCGLGNVPRGKIGKFRLNSKFVAS